MPNAKGGYDRVKNKRDLLLVKCEMDNFKYKNRSEVMMYSIDKLMCIKDPDFSLQGDLYSDRFRYLQLKLQRCRGKDCYNSS